jgi:putative phosphoribosyl transferase
MAIPFKDRRDAGRQLAARLGAYAGRPDVLVLGLPRGGVPVAYEVAEALDAPLDVFLVRKLGVPGHEELAMGAIASGGVRVLNEDVLSDLRLPDAAIEAVAAREQQEMARREGLYRDARPAPEVQGRTVILVDDGLATGSTMRAAAVALRQQRPARLVAAVPVAAAATCGTLASVVDEAVCAVEPQPFFAVGLWYEDFSPTGDEEVRRLLARAAERRPVAGATGGSSAGASRDPIAAGTGFPREGTRPSGWAAEGAPGAGS